MNNKVLVKVIVPYFEKSFDMYLPVNELVWKNVKLITKSIFDFENIAFNYDDSYYLVNSDTGIVYDNNVVLYDTDIRNGSKLVLL